MKLLFIKTYDLVVNVNVNTFTGILISQIYNFKILQWVDYTAPLFFIGKRHFKKYKYKSEK